MTTYEFLTQSPKEIGAALKAAGIVKYKDVPSDLDKLSKLLELTPDERVDYIYQLSQEAEVLNGMSTLRLTGASALSALRLSTM
jgi:hypothetical protein